MADPQSGIAGLSKAQSVCDALNRLLQNLIIQCSKSDGVLDYFCCSVIGYGNGKVRSGFSGVLAGRPYASMSELDAAPLRLETRKQRIPDGMGGLIEIDVKVPVWVDPVASGSTPMCEALTMAHQLAQAWIERNPDGFPPIVMNLTDGEANDGSPVGIASQLRSLSSTDGNLLLFNMHLSDKKGTPSVFPTSDALLMGNFAKMLFSMSSTLPTNMVEQAQSMELPADSGSRGFIFNADVVTVIQFLEIGTKPSNIALR